MKKLEPLIGRVKTLVLISYSVNLYVIIAAFLHDLRLGVLFLLLTISFRAALQARAYLGVFTSLGHLRSFTTTEREMMVLNYHQNPNGVCQHCGDYYKKHKMTKKDDQERVECREGQL